MTYLASNKPITLPEIARMKREGEKIAMLTCYDASFAALEDRCGTVVEARRVASRVTRGVR